MATDNLQIRGGRWYIVITSKGQKYRKSTGVKVDQNRNGEDKAPSREVLRARDIAAADPAKFAKECQERSAPVKDTRIASYVASHLRACSAHVGVKKKAFHLKCLVERFPGHHLDDIDQGDSIAWARELEAEGLAPNTVNFRLGVASAMFGQAIEEGFAKNNPFKRLKSGSNRGGVTPDKDRLIKCLEHDGDGEDDRIYFQLAEFMKPVFKLGMYAGLRRSEFVKLRADWVDLETGWIIIPKEATKAGAIARARKQNPNGRRPIPLNPETLEHMRTVSRFRKHPFFFSDDQGRPITEEQITGEIRTAAYNAGANKYCDKAKNAPRSRCGDWKNCPICSEEKITTHSLRRTATTHFILNGVHDRVIMEMMGWSSADMVKLYNSIDPLHLKRAMDEMEELRELRSRLRMRKEANE